MIVINTVDAQRFSFNGIEYFKNFTPVVNGNTIRLLNTYDSCIEIVKSTNFADFTVNGNTFLNVTSLQSALLPVVYTRNNLSDINEINILGVRLEANVSGTYNIDINVASDFHLTLTANTAFTFTNLPTGTEVVRLKLRLTGEFTPTFSQGWLLPFGDDYDGTKWNDVIVEISNGNATFEKGELIFQQREDS